MLGSTRIDLIDNTDILDTYRDLYLSEKEREEKLKALRYTTSQWSKGAAWCKKGRWHSIYGYDPRKGN